MPCRLVDWPMVLGVGVGVGGDYFFKSFSTSKCLRPFKDTYIYIFTYIHMYIYIYNGY